MERSIVMSGAGGQGIQLCTKMLVMAAARANMHVMHFGWYAGPIRGGMSKCMMVIGDESLVSPPIVKRPWCGIAMHDKYSADLEETVQTGGILIVNSTIVPPQTRRKDITLVEVPATKIANDLGNPLACGLVAIGALAATTRIVPLEEIAKAIEESLPPYRRHLAEANHRCLRAGAQYVESRDLESILTPAWARA